MNRIPLFVIVLSLFYSCTSSEEQKARRKSIVVTVDGRQQFYLEADSVSKDAIDSLLTAAIGKYRTLTDTPQVVINADTASLYGHVYRIMTIAKKAGAKVVVTVK